MITISVQIQITVQTLLVSMQWISYFILFFLLYSAYLLLEKIYHIKNQTLCYIFQFIYEPNFHFFKPKAQEVPFEVKILNEIYYMRATSFNPTLFWMEDEELWLFPVYQTEFNLSLYPTNRYEITASTFQNLYILKFIEKCIIVISFLRKIAQLQPP